MLLLEALKYRQGQWVLEAFLELALAQEIVVFLQENSHFEPKGRSGKLTHFEL